MQRELNRITDDTAEYAPEAVPGYQPNETAEPRIKQAAYEPTMMTGEDVWVKRTALAPGCHVNLEGRANTPVHPSSPLARRQRRSTASKRCAGGSSGRPN